MTKGLTTLGIAAALGSALLFGFVNVVAKGGDLDPLLLTGLAYLIAGLLAAPTLRSWRPEARDLPVLLLMAIIGGVLAPASLFYGLREAAAVDASLLLTCEMVFTSAMAAVLLRERLRPQAATGVVLLLLASVTIALGAADSGQSTLVGAMLVLGAALGWAIDNILGVRLMARYRPVHMLAVKGLGGGALAILAYAALGGSPVVPAEQWWRVLFVGGLGIGASAFCCYVALRTIGATPDERPLPADVRAGRRARWRLGPRRGARASARHGRAPAGLRRHAGRLAAVGRTCRRAWTGLTWGMERHPLEPGHGRGIVDRRRAAVVGLALAAASGLLYGSGNVAVKVVGAHPLVQAGVGYLVGGTLLSPTLRGLRIPAADWPKVLAMALIGGGLSPALLFYGLRHASVVDAGLLLTLELAATALLAVLFLGEREGGAAGSASDASASRPPWCPWPAAPRGRRAFWGSAWCRQRRWAGASTTP